MLKTTSLTTSTTAGITHMTSETKIKVLAANIAKLDTNELWDLVNELISEYPVIANLLRADLDTAE